MRNASFQHAKYWSWVVLHCLGMAHGDQIPDFKRIYLHYRNLIIEGRISPGDRLPTAKAMAQEWGVSDATTRRAMSMLKDEGLTTATTKAGTIVSRSSMSFGGNIANGSVVRQMASTFGEGTETVYTFAGYAEAGADVADALGVVRGSEVIRRDRQRLRGGEPVTMSTSWHPADHAYSFPRLLVPENFDRGLKAVEEATGHTIGALRERVAASLATQEQASFFGLEVPAAVLLKEHLWLDEAGDPFCFGQGVHRPHEWSDYEVVVNDA